MACLSRRWPSFAILTGDCCASGPSSAIRATRPRFVRRSPPRVSGAASSSPAKRAPAAVAAAYSAADAFVLPSFHEGYGMVCAEAMANDLPVIATIAGAIPETVPPSAGLLFRPAIRRRWQRLCGASSRSAFCNPVSCWLARGGRAPPRLAKGDRRLGSGVRSPCDATCAVMMPEPAGQHRRGSYAVTIPLSGMRRRA